MVKNKLASYSKATILSAIALGLMFIGIPAQADQAFLFSDDLSTQSDIDQSQTSARFGLGGFSTAEDSVSSAVVSKVIANPFKAIISARLDVSVNIPSNARVIYYLSNNNGFRWMQINPGFTYTFDSTGNELKWRVVLTRESPIVASAFLDNVNITYTVSDSLAPAPSVRPNSGSLGAILYGGDLNSFVCGSLASVGLGCGAPQRVATPVYGQSNLPLTTPTAAPAPQNTFPGPDQLQQSNSSLQAAIANTTVKRTVSDDEVILVKVPVLAGASENIKPTLGLTTDDAIFEIVRGQKHFIPTIDIFFDYGFSLDAVQSVTVRDLEPFPRAKLVNIYKDKKRNYYITEGYMIRLIPNERVFESYGDRKEDIITISKKEFNFYPRNQYVFLENPLNADVYQIINDGTKRFVVPQVWKRLKINLAQIAPINKIQLDAYQNSNPIIF